MDRMIKLALFVLVALCCALAVDAVDCGARNSSCSNCVKEFECYWCGANQNSTKSPCLKRAVWKLTADCSSAYHLYPSCAISGLAVMIIVIVVVCLVVIGFATCICCCCCCGNKKAKRKWQKEDDREKKDREERRLRQEGRRTERQERNDEIRKKYGLYKEDGGASSEGRYQRFDNA